MKRALLIIFAVLSIDQVSKILVKTKMPLGKDHLVNGWDWFHIHFVENPGMAFGLEFGGLGGKLALTIFRLIVIIGIGFYLRNIIRQRMHKGFIFSIALIFAGAVGNLIDSMFYGLIFDSGMTWDSEASRWMYYSGTSKLNFEGYTQPLMGHVVDMLHFPLFHGHYPSWIPKIGGNEFTFFAPVFNIADSAISIGIGWIFVRQKSFFKVAKNEKGKREVMVVSEDEANGIITSEGQTPIHTDATTPTTGSTPNATDSETPQDPKPSAPDA